MRRPLAQTLKSYLLLVGCFKSFKGREEEKQKKMKSKETAKWTP